MLQSYLWPVEKVKVGDHLVTCAAKVPENFKFFMHLTLTGAAQVFRRNLGYCPNLGGGVCVCVWSFAIPNFVKFFQKNAEFALELTASISDAILIALSHVT